MKRRSAAIAMAMALMAATVSPVAAAGVDFGNVEVGDSASQTYGIPLSYALSGIPPDVVVYSGGSPGIDLALSLQGLSAPLTAGALYGQIGEVTSTFHLGFDLDDDTAFAVDAADCATGTGACVASIDFIPPAPGPYSSGVVVSVQDLDVSGGGAYGSLIDLMAPLFAPVLEDQLHFSVAGVGIEPGGGGTGGESGGVTLEVAVEPEPVPCLIIDTTLVDFGTLPFSQADAVSSASRQVTATSCSAGPQELLAQGTDATGDGNPAATWSLSSTATDPCVVGPDTYGVELSGDAGAGSSAIQLSTDSSAWLDLDEAASVDANVTYQMPCAGSSGAGQTMTSQITLVATMP